jgi:hypothetical protein
MEMQKEQGAVGISTEDTRKCSSDCQSLFESLYGSPLASTYRLSTVPTSEVEDPGLKYFYDLWVFR